jgi:hypothetical protein
MKPRSNSMLKRVMAQILWCLLIACSGIGASLATSADDGKHEKQVTAEATPDSSATGEDQAKSSQDKNDKKETKTDPVRPAIAKTNVTISITAEGQTALAQKSRIEWKGVGTGCEQEQGTMQLLSSEPTPMILPLCEVELTIFVGGFSAKRATLQGLSENRKKFGEPIPIRISLKEAERPKVSWGSGDSP